MVLAPIPRDIFQILLLVIITSSLEDQHLLTMAHYGQSPLLAHHVLPIIMTAQQLPTWPTVLAIVGCKAGPGPRPASWKRLRLPSDG